MKDKVLYIYGYGSNNVSSSTMNVMKTIMEELGYELISIKYDQMNPRDAVNTLEEYIENNKIRCVIGHSLGGFIAMCLTNNVKKLVINPCLMPHIELPKLGGNITEKTIADYKFLYEWLTDGNGTPWTNLLEEIIGLFGTKDELFSYYKQFRSMYPFAFKFNATHRPTVESFTKDIKQTIKEFFN